LPAEVTLVSCDIAEKALSKDVTLSPDDEPPDDPADEGGVGDAEPLHAAATMPVTASAARSLARAFKVGSPPVVAAHPAEGRSPRTPGHPESISRVDRCAELPDGELRLGVVTDVPSTWHRTPLGQC
jgi:hypothetical protein